MSPRVLLIHGYDFFFYSKEENRKHIHVEKGDHEAKVWLEPMIEVAYNYGFSSREIKFILQIIERYERDKPTVEVTGISRKGLILMVRGKEYALPYSRFPWFEQARVSDVFDVEMRGRSRIRWEALDVDLSLSILENPDAYPLTAR